MDRRAESAPTRGYYPLRGLSILRYAGMRNQYVPLLSESKTSSARRHVLCVGAKMSGIGLHQQLFDAMRKADECVSEMGELGAKVANAEREYRVAKQKRILYYRDKKFPATLIPDIVKGSQDIADLAFARDCAEAEYKANYEALLWAKKRVDVIREQIDREFRG